MPVWDKVPVLGFRPLFVTCKSSYALMSKLGALHSCIHPTFERLRLFSQKCKSRQWFFNDVSAGVAFQPSGTLPMIEILRM